MSFIKGNFQMSMYPVAVTPADVDTLMASWVTGKILAEPSISGVKNLSAVSIYFDPGQGHSRHRNLGWEPVRILSVYSPAGPEAGMRSSAEFTVLPAGQVPARRTLATD